MGWWFLTGSPFVVTLTGQTQLDRIQANITKAFNSVIGPFIGGNILPGITLTANTPLAINHGLGRQPVIWTLTDNNAAAIIYRTKWDQNTITLEANGNCVISIWIN
jgi:hypothetical protein